MRFCCKFLIFERGDDVTIILDNLIFCLTGLHLPDHRIVDTVSDDNSMRTKFNAQTVRSNETMFVD